MSRCPAFIRAKACALLARCVAFMLGASLINGAAKAFTKASSIQKGGSNGVGKGRKKRWKIAGKGELWYTDTHEYTWYTLFIELNDDKWWMGFLNCVGTWFLTHTSGDFSAQNWRNIGTIGPGTSHNIPDLPLALTSHPAHYLDLPKGCRCRRGEVWLVIMTDAQLPAH